MKLYTTPTPPPPLTPHQLDAFNSIHAFLKHPNRERVYVLSGYAGTGKTTLLQHLRHRNLAYIAPTGKAAQVLTSRGLPATTIHGLIYERIGDTIPPVFRRRTHIDCAAIICDEASMVDSDILLDLLRFRKPILFIGDPYQLPPVGRDPGLFTQYPNFTSTLTEIHRQALDNPIIALATYLRTTPSAHPRNWRMPNSSGVQILSRRNVKIDVSSIDQCIVGYNATRFNVNKRMRERLGFVTRYPSKGDRLIVLRNNHELGLVNGQQLIALEDASNWDSELDVQDPITNQKYSIEYLKEVFDGDSECVKTCPRTITPIDYAYAITCHKSQGSEFPRVAIIDEPIGDDKNRWRYTAVTRAKESLTYFI